MRDNFKIDFIGIGVPRAGTTWLFECLGEHPQICTSDKKEIKFFQYNFLYNQGLEKFRENFSHCTDDKIKGTFSPSYLYSLEAAERIKKNFPNVKLIVCFRDPVERAYSHYFLKKSKNHQMEDFGKVIRKPGNKYIEYGLYAKYLKNYLSLFNRDQFIFIFQKEIDENPEKVLHNLYGFLGIDQSFIPSVISNKINQNVESRYYSSGFDRVSRRIFSGKSRLYQFLRRINTINIAKSINLPDMDERDENYLKRMFLEDTAELENILGRKSNF